MRYSPYRTKPDRFNPEFIGIAERHSQHKHTRKMAEHQRRELHSDFQYSDKLDESLTKTIELKASQLRKLKAARKRFEQERQEKREREEQRAAELEQLRAKNVNTKCQANSKILKARTALLKKNKTARDKVEQQLSTLDCHYQSLRESRERDNQKRYLTIKQQKTIGQMKVDAYHRRRNLSSLNEYQSRIQEQLNLYKEHTKVANKHQEHIHSLSQSVQLKKNLLSRLQREIGSYCTNSRSIMMRSRCRSNLFSDQSIEPGEIQDKILFSEESSPN